MEYFNFVEFDDKVFIPISKPAKSQKLQREVITMDSIVTSTNNFVFNSRLFKSNDKNVNVTICNPNISYEKWLKRIERSVGDKLFNDPIAPTIWIRYEHSAPFITHYSSVRETITSYSPTTPINIRIDIGCNSSSIDESWIILLAPTCLFEKKDINAKTSFFIHNKNDNTYVEKLKWLSLIAEILGPQEYNQLIKDFKIDAENLCSELLFAEPDEFFEILKRDYALKDVRISIGNKSWIVYTINQE